MKKIDDKKKIKDPLTNKNYVRGKEYINPINGKKQIFDSYITTYTYKTGKYKGFYTVYFVDKNRFNEIEIRRKKRIEEVNRNILNGKIKLTKSINPDTNKPYKLGDAKGKGEKIRYFLNYENWPKGKIEPPFEGTFFNVEKWATEKTYKKKRLRSQFIGVKSRAKRNNVPFQINFEFAMSIFPSDNKCPVTKKEFEFGYGDDGRVLLAPSLDKIVPEKGYIENNIVWVSSLVNTVKQDATILELEQIGNFYKNLEENIRNYD